MDNPDLFLRSLPDYKKGVLNDVYKLQTTNNQSSGQIRSQFQIPSDDHLIFNSENKNNLTLHTNVASWVEEEHKIPFVLAVSLYNTPIQEYNNWVRLSYLTNVHPRFSIWKNQNGQCIVGCKGTELDNKKDIYDDLLIAFDRGGFGKAQLTTTLFDEIKPQIHHLLKTTPKEKIFICGHSLGGYVAYKLATHFDTKGCGFNTAAPPTNVLQDSPGSEQFTHYHILGDLISSHFEALNAKRVLIDKDNNFFVKFWLQHSTDRFWANDQFQSKEGNPTDEGIKI
jgi:hypothetical protein